MKDDLRKRLTFIAQWGGRIDTVDVSATAWDAVCHIDKMNDELARVKAKVASLERNLDDAVSS